MQTEIESIQNKLTEGPSSNELTDMLVGNPAGFLEHIRNHKDEVHSWVLGECKTYKDWGSPAIHQLVMLTGELVRKPTTELGSRFFGGRNPEGIPEDLAIEIFNELSKYPIIHEDTTITHLDTNYYGENLEEFLCDYQWRPYCRTGNEKLLQTICEHFGLPPVEVEAD